MSMTTIPQRLPRWSRVPPLPVFAHVEVTARPARFGALLWLAQRGPALVKDLPIYLVVIVTAALLPAERDGRLASALRRLCAGIVDRLLP